MGGEGRYVRFGPSLHVARAGQKETLSVAMCASLRYII